MSDAEFDRWLVHRVQDTARICSGARMGAPDDPRACMDTSCGVYGIDGLRVVDASAFPPSPGGTTNLAVIMMAEKVADEIMAGA